MSVFRRARDGRLAARFTAQEADLMTVLASEAEELAGLATDGRAASADPALRRLLPDAYPDDPEASAEFRRFTAEGLAERKAQAARAMSQSLAHEPGRPAQVRLDEAEASAWLRTITGIRLVLASRLGIEHDEDTGRADSEESVMQLLVYNWLAAVQDSLVNALSRRR